MTLYTVVVCSNCKYARVVVRHPERTTCGKCQTSKRFDSLRHFYQSEDKHAAAKVRGEIQARVNGMEESFSDALDRGVLDEVTDRVVSDDEYLREMGADIEEIEQAKDRAEAAMNRSRSQRAIMTEALTDYGESRESVLDFAQEHGIDGDWAENYLDKALATGHVSGSRNGPYRLL